MPLPLWAAGTALAAIKNPQVQNAVLGAGTAALGGLGRGVDYVGRGAANLGQQVGTGLADRLGGLGQQYLPESVNTAGGYGRSALGYLSGGAGGLYNAVTGNQPQQQGMPGGQMGGMNQMGGQGQMGMMGQGGMMSPERMMQQNFMQDINQPYGYDYGTEQQQMINQFNQNYLPDMDSKFGLMGGRSSGAFRRSATGALANLQTNLAALGTQGRYRENELNQRRLGDISQYLGGQQRLGLDARRLGLEGTIANRDAAYRNLGLMSQFGQNQYANRQGQNQTAADALRAYMAMGLGQQFTPLRQAQGQSGFGQFVQGAIPVVKETAKAGAAMASGLPLF